MDIVCIKNSELHGLGVFATCTIQKDTIIEDLLKNSKIRKFQSMYTIQIGIDTHIESNGIVSIINHSCEPNCEITPDIKLIAIQNINKDDELTYNYLTTELELTNKFLCLCGSKHCMGYISGNVNRKNNSNINIVWKL